MNTQEYSEKERACLEKSQTNNHDLKDKKVPHSDCCTLRHFGKGTKMKEKLPYQTILETVQTEYKENFSLCVYASPSLFSTDNFLCPKKLKIANCDKKSMMVHHEKN